ncbi:helix-turn-helix domain-containing protein [Flammeovirga kamogawensis]|uniref:AraC family transcriptional regulator n=1 Tax=Flammeovirga kamogawensis TaxID=373891 RepID=A0ABX8GSV0_9BACT|nr:AraC family transcriptional regulator [Flammeovirga kamogawensis]MBB6463969.1 AraC-like DNA-binding protein [Flammeovirga kamogawensis]QWG06596.1 AraC family transcriptional regulator [Flammeovirga kamogawensis]
MIDLLTLRIKNMVCERCILTVWQALIDAGAVVERVDLGVAYISVPLSVDQRKEIEQTFKKLGFSFLNDKQSSLVEGVKNFIHHKFSNLDEKQWTSTLSEELQKELGKDYTTISTLFSNTEGITIEKYLSNQKVEKVKEFLSYNEMSLSQIADVLGYSSTQYLSRKFKQSTGMTPSEFKKNSHKPLRKSLSI